MAKDVPQKNETTNKIPSAKKGFEGMGAFKIPVSRKEMNPIDRPDSLVLSTKKIFYIPQISME
jgi:hypothetical protein